MATPSNSDEDFQVLDEFVCEAIPFCSGTPPEPPRRSAGRAEDEGMEWIQEDGFDLDRP